GAANCSRSSTSSAGGPVLVTRPPTWRNYFRGLKAVVEEDARLSSSAYAEPLMSKTNGHSQSSSPGRRNAMTPDALRHPAAKKDVDGRGEAGPGGADITKASGERFC